MNGIQNELESLLISLQDQKGRTSSKSHLKSALYDWRIENNWVNPNAEIISIDKTAYAFLTFTKREPRHCTLRHFFVLESERGKGVGRALICKMKEHIERRQINILRFFADIPSVVFYEKLGYKWHGNSKTGLPFYYGDIDGNLINLPASQKRYVR
jgi:GNAT superfamily N-acetyltransferase